MTESNPSVVTVVWRLLIAMVVVLARLALDRLAVRGHARRSRRTGR